MTTPYTLNELIFKEQSQSRQTEGSEGSISLSSTKSSKNELDSIMNKVRNELSSVVSSTDSSASNEDLNSAEKEEARDIKRANAMGTLVQKKTEWTAQNIILRIRYLSSPLRLFLKLQVMNMPAEIQQGFYHALKITERVKQDIFSGWKEDDSLGIYILTKMYHMKLNLFPFILDHAQFNTLLDPEKSRVLTDSFQKQIAFFLFNKIMNVDTAEHPSGTVHIRDAYIDGLFDNFLKEDIDDLVQTGIPYDQMKDHLKNKIAFDLNVYASIVFKKPVKYKYVDGSNRPVEVKYDAEHLLQEMVKEFENIKLPHLGGNTSYADQLRYWLTNDEDTTHKPRHHVHHGGRSRRGNAKKNRSARALIAAAA